MGGRQSGSGAIQNTFRGRLQNSSNRLEREHIWLGTHAEYGYPFLLHERILKEHVQLVGQRKWEDLTTSRADAYPADTEGDSAVIVIDLKGDMALIETVRWSHPIRRN